MDALPEWPEGTVAVLSTAGAAPHAIPVSLALRTGERSVLLGLAERRESLARLREDPRCALTILAPGQAFTAHGSARMLDETAAGVVAARVDVERIQDHAQPTFEIEDGARFHWTDDAAASRDREVRAALERLAGR